MLRRIRFSRLIGLAALAGTLLAPAAWAQGQAEEVALLREQVRLLTDKVKQLEDRMQPPPTAASTGTLAAADPLPKPAVLAVSDRSVSFSSGDGLAVIRLRGLLQVDSRSFFSDAGIRGNDTFLIRRARISLEGSFNRLFQFQIVPDFAGASATLVNANVTAAFSPAFQVRLGKFKTPVGIEQIQADPTNAFLERAHPSNLMPGFDIGLQAGGDLAGGLVRYTVGVFNALPDSGTLPNADSDDEKGLVARVMLRPGGGLEVGLGATYSPNLTAASSLGGGYRTDGQQRYFAYDVGTTASGDGWRITPQAALYRGAFGAMAEFVVSAIEVQSAATRAELQHQAWHVMASYVLTGENASYTGVVPRRSFNLAEGNWGSFEVTARAAGIELDADTFPTFASGRTNASEVTSFGLGLNWYLSAGMRFMADYLQSDLSSVQPTTSPLITAGEKTLMTRLQLIF